MVSRERILEAAGRVYAKHGFKGATTRAIANEAGVNEVTLFRTFGSKGALLEAVLISHVDDQPCATLPDDPHDPLTELADFIAANLARVTEMRPLLIHAMGEVEERADAMEFACRGRHQIHDIVTAYIRRLQAKGFADPDADVEAAAVMITGTVISDVMGRPIVPDVYPPIGEVAQRYAALILRAIGVREVETVPTTLTARNGAAPHAPRSLSPKSHSPKSTRL